MSVSFSGDQGRGVKRTTNTAKDNSWRPICLLKGTGMSSVQRRGTLEPLAADILNDTKTSENVQVFKIKYVYSS